jgi:hypothetical protein
MAYLARFRYLLRNPPWKTSQVIRNSYLEVDPIYVPIIPAMLYPSGETPARRNATCFREGLTIFCLSKAPLEWAESKAQ